MSIKPKLSTFDVAMLTVSLVIGIGIFRTPAMVAAATRTPLLFFGAWGLGCLITLAGALTFAEIGSRFPEPGSYYKVLAECYHSSVAFLCNWTNVWMVNAASGAGVALIAAEHLCPLTLPAAWQGNGATQLTAAGLIVVLMAVNWLGIRAGAWAQNILSLLKIGMILLLAGVAIFFRGGATQAAAPHVSWGKAIPALWLGFISVFFSCGGYQNTINFGADVRNARKSLPKGIILGMLAVGGLYLLINFAYYRVLGLPGIAASKLVAAEVARVCFGAGGHLVISLAIVLSALGFLNATLMQIPRALHAMAEDRVLPALFQKVNSRTQTQEFALLFFGGFMVGTIALMGTFEKIVGFVIFQDALNIAAVASTIFVLRRRQRGMDGAGTFKVPLYPLLPLLFVAFLVTLSLSVFLNQRREALIGLAILLSGVPFFFLMRYLNRKRP